MNPPILRLLGGAVIEYDGVPMGGPAAHRHRLALLALLAVSRRPMTRDKLMAYLWPERDTDGARNLLRTALYELRKLLGDNAIRSTGDALSIDPSILRCDVPEFEAAVAAGDIERAASLFAGPFLDGFFMKDASEFEHWVDGERARLERLHRGVADRLRDGRPAAETSPRPAALAVASVDAPAVAPVAAVTRRRGRLYKVAAPVAVVLVASLSAVLIASNHSTQSAAARPVLLPDGAPGTALEFDGRTATASTDAGTVVTTKTDDIAVDMMVRYDGQTSNEHQMLFYNGHGGLSGWGLLVIGAEDGRPDGTITVLAGGINVMATPLVLARGVWQHVTAERRGGVVTVTLDDSSVALGQLPVNPIGGAHKAIERTSIGGDGLYDQPSAGFHGAIDRVRIRDLAGAYWIERWFLDEGTGSLSVGAKGTVLHVGAARWVPAPPLSIQTVFWSRLEALCDQAFRGRALDSTAVLHVMRCKPNEIRIAVHVGADHSRTVTLTKRATNIELRAERHRQDGADEAEGRYALATTTPGSFAEQEFGDTAGGEHVRIDIEPANSLSYVLQRGGADRERMQFDLHRQVAVPPLPWGAKP